MQHAEFNVSLTWVSWNCSYLASQANYKKLDDLLLGVLNQKLLYAIANERLSDIIREAVHIACNLIKETDSNDRHGRVEHVVECYEYVVVYTLSRETTIHGEPELHEREGEIFVEEVAQEKRHSVVRPVPM